MGPPLKTYRFMYQANAFGLLNVVSVALWGLRLRRHREPGVCTGWERPRARPRGKSVVLRLPVAGGLTLSCQGADGWNSFSLGDF
jgi:hypothetical protein